MDNKQFVSVFTGSRIDVEIVKSMLESNGIVCFIQDKSLSAVTSAYFSSGGDIHLLVASDQSELATSLIQQTK